MNDSIQTTIWIAKLLKVVGVMDDLVSRRASPTYEFKRSASAVIYERSLNDNLQFVSIVLKMNPFAFYIGKRSSPQGLNYWTCQNPFRFFHRFPSTSLQFFTASRALADIPTRVAFSSCERKFHRNHLMSILLFLWALPMANTFAISCEKSGVPYPSH